jgi:hypothetical protein
MKGKIQSHFRGKVIITEVNGKENVVTMWSNASSILNDFHSYQNKESLEEEKNRIIQTAAKLIKNDIKALKQQNQVYPEIEKSASLEEACLFLPGSLLSFLQSLFSGVDSNLKIASIGQAMIQATRRRVILAPLQLGLGVQLHHHFASKFLIDILHKHGFCSSYGEVTKFERSAAVSQSTQVPNISSTTNFLQYAADNVDHNIRTIDGHNTFHGMGMIATITPGTSNIRSIPRVLVSAEDIVAVGNVPLKHFLSELDGLYSKRYNALPEYNPEVLVSKLDLLWNISLSFKSKRVAWSGMM